MQNITKRLIRWAVIIAFILLIPLLGNWPWTLSDFVFMGVLLFGSAATYELVARRVRGGAYRSAVDLAVVASVLLVWINAAVGIIGDGPVNMMYFGVLAIGILGAFLLNAFFAILFIGSTLLFRRASVTSKESVSQ